MTSGPRSPDRLHRKQVHQNRSDCESTEVCLVRRRRRQLIKRRTPRVGGRHLSRATWGPGARPGVGCSGRRVPPSSFPRLPGLPDSWVSGKTYTPHTSGHPGPSPTPRRSPAGVAPTHAPPWCGGGETTTHEGVPRLPRGPSSTTVSRAPSRPAPPPIPTTESSPRPTLPPLTATLGPLPTVSLTSTYTVALSLSDRHLRVTPTSTGASPRKGKTERDLFEILLVRDRGSCVPGHSGRRTGLDARHRTSVRDGLFDLFYG